VQPHAASNLLELSHARYNSLTLTRLPARFLALAWTCSLPLELCLICSLGTAETIQFSRTSFMLYRRWIRLLRSYQDLWKYFDRCQRCDRTTKFKGVPPSGWIQLLVPIFTHASLLRPSFLSQSKISMKSDYPQLRKLALFWSGGRPVGCGWKNGLKLLKICVFDHLWNLGVRSLRCLNGV